MKDFGLILNNHSLKATPQRLEMLSIVDHIGHVSIDGLYSKLKTKFENISLATIYKNVNSMVESKLLFEVKIPNAKSVYEIVKDDHSHLVCKSCNAVIDIKVNMDSMVNDISFEYNFAVDRTDFILSGLCSGCRD
ncbi:MAG: Fur family transcriptional regulator [Campylobacterota bacterium]|nr:Fur family transcriptional regulator [Campylobacterota bacterium]